MRKINQSLYFLILLIVAALAACRKDEPLTCEKADENCCEDFPEMWSSWFSESRFQYQLPCFNPNNPNEFAYYFKDWELGKRQLIKYNMLTKQKTILVDNIQIHVIKWSRKDWIAFTRITDGYVDHIFVLKDNRDSLRQFTVNSANHSPAWDAEGDKLYWAYSPVLGHPYFFLSQNLYGGNVDTLLNNEDNYAGISNCNDISVNNNLVSQTLIGNLPHLATSDLNTTNLSFQSLVNLEQVFNSEFPSDNGLCWSADGRYVYFTLRKIGLIKIDINTGKKEKLLCVCESKYYSKISCSSDGKYLIAERVDRELEHNSSGEITGEIITSSSIVLIDLITLTETKLNLE